MHHPALLSQPKERKKSMFNSDEELEEKKVEKIVLGSIGHTLHS